MGHDVKKALAIATLLGMMAGLINDFVIPILAHARYVAATFTFLLLASYALERFSALPGTTQGSGRRLSAQCLSFLGGRPIRIFAGAMLVVTLGVSSLRGEQGDVLASVFDRVSEIHSIVSRIEGRLQVDEAVRLDDPRKELVSMGVAYQASALGEAIRRNDGEVVRLFLKSGFNLKADTGWLVYSNLDQYLIYALATDFFTSTTVVAQLVALSPPERDLMADLLATHQPEIFEDSFLAFSALKALDISSLVLYAERSPSSAVNARKEAASALTFLEKNTPDWSGETIQECIRGISIRGHHISDRDRPSCERTLDIYFGDLSVRRRLVEGLRAAVKALHS